MRAFVFLASVILQLTVVGAALAWSYSAVVTWLVVVCGALTFGLVGLWGRYRAVAYRDHWVRRTIVQSYECDGVQVGLDTLTEIVGTEDVRAAQVAANKRMEALLYDRWANGDSER